MNPGDFHREMAGEFGKELARLLAQKAAEMWRNRGESPLLVFFDERATYHDVRLRNEHDRWARFCHVLVHNGSPYTWGNCVATLKSISRLVEGGRFVPEPLYRMPLQLRWAHVGDFRTIDLKPGETRRLDLCYTVDGSPEVRFAVPREPHGIKTDYGPGIYKIRVEVTTPHPVPADGAFLVIYAGDWKDVKVRPDAPEISIAVPHEEFTAVSDAARKYPASDVRSLGSKGTDPVGALIARSRDKGFNPDPEDEQ